MERRRFRQRSAVLTAIAVMLFVVACGRATEQQIDQALGITPTPTTDATRMAQATETAAAEDEAEAATPPVDENLGIASAGRTRFQFTCQTCHAPGGSGSAPDLLASGGVGADIDYATLYPILREGEGHSPAPGPYAVFTLTDDDIANIAAYIRENAAP